MTFISMRRISPSLPTALQAELKDYLRPTPPSQPKAPKIEEPEEDFIIEPEPVFEEAKVKPKKPRRGGIDNKSKPSTKGKT